MVMRHLACKGQASAWTEVADQLASVVVLPAQVRSAVGGLHDQAHKKLGQFDSEHLGAEQLRQLGERDEPLRVPGRPVVIGPVGDPEHLVVSLGRLMEELSDSSAVLVHPDGLPLIGGDGARPASRLASALQGGDRWGISDPQLTRS
jgi:hypothetical protein